MFVNPLMLVVTKGHTYLTNLEVLVQSCVSINDLLLSPEVEGLIDFLEVFKE